MIFFRFFLTLLPALDVHDHLQESLDNEEHVDPAEDDEGDL